MKKRNEDNQNIREDNSEELSAEALGFINRLLERLHRADYTNHGSKIEIVYVASGGQHVETIQSQNIYTNKRQSVSEEPNSVTPPPEAMARAVERTMAQGYWWASTAWAVVYRVYQMKGYGGGFSQFVKEVATWPRTRQWEMECNFDAVQKPVSSGRLSGMPETWRANGAQEQATKLAFALMEELQSC